MIMNRFLLGQDYRGSLDRNRRRITRQEREQEIESGDSKDRIKRRPRTRSRTAKTGANNMSSFSGLSGMIMGKLEKGFETGPEKGLLTK